MVLEGAEKVVDLDTVKNTDILPEAEVYHCRLLEWTDLSAFQVDMTRERYRQYLFVQSGSGIASIDGLEWTLQPGMLLVVPEGSRFDLRLERGTTGIWLAGAIDLMTHRVAASLFLRGSDYWLSYHVPKCLPLLVGEDRIDERDAMQAELEAACDRLGGACDVAVIAYFFVVLTMSRKGDWLLSSQRTDDDIQSIEDPGVQALMRFRGLVEQNFRRHMSVDAYAREMGMTTSRLTRLCVEFSDRSPLRIIHDRIVREAKRMLGSATWSVAEVAYDLGFSDPAYFSRFFRRHAGVPPATFRNVSTASATPSHATPLLRVGLETHADLANRRASSMIEAA